MQKTTFEIDGGRFSTLSEFCDEIGRVLIPATYCGRNLDAFNDILRGGSGTPEEGFVLRWKNVEQSRGRLGAERLELLIDIIRAHCSGGEEEEDGIELEFA